MVKKILQVDGNNTQPHQLNISGKQTEMLARRLLPEIKRFFADEDVRRDLEEWKKQHGK